MLSVKYTSLIIHLWSIFALPKVSFCYRGDQTDQKESFFCYNCLYFLSNVCVNLNKLLSKLELKCTIWPYLKYNKGYWIPNDKPTVRRSIHTSHLLSLAVRRQTRSGLTFQTYVARLRNTTSVKVSDLRMHNPPSRKFL